MKPITHARKAMLLEYFNVLETQLAFSLKEAAAAGEAVTGEAFITAVATQVQERMAQTPESSGPSFQQICKNLENVLDPGFAPEAQGDPLRAVRLLRQQLVEQAEFTPPPGGLWKPAKWATRRKDR